MSKQIIMNTDPTRTTLLRRKFITDMNRRFAKLQKAITKLIVTDDVFGLEEPVGKVELRKAGLSILQQKRAFQFMTNPQKIREYQKWLQIQIDTEILTTDGLGKPWTSTYIESAHKKGMLRAYTDTNKAKLATDVPDFYAGSREQFLRTAFGQPELLSKIELLSLRAFEQLKGVTTTMSSQMSRILAEGLSRGDGSAKIARTLNKQVATLTRTRSRMIARTEIINAHAEGQLDSFELLGVKEVGAIVEWSTAGDERVCAECAAMEGETFTIDQARGMIPLHPNCRCAWIPAEQVIKKKRKVKTKKKTISEVPSQINQYSLGGNKFTYNTLSNVDKAAILEYQSGIYKSELGGYGTIQDYLRNKTIAKWLQKEGVTVQKLKRLIKEIDTAVTKSTAGSDMVVYRGVRETAEVFQIKNISELKVGLKFTDDAYVSTSSSKTIANKFTDKLNHWDDPKLLHIRVPENTKAFPTDIVNVIGEKEIVLPRGSEFIVTKIQGKNVYVDLI